MTRNMPTQVETNKRGLSRQIAEEVSFAKVTDVVAEQSENPSSQATKIKKPRPKPKPKPKPKKKN